MAKTKKPSDYEETWVGKLKRKSHELLKGEKAYISKERADEMKLARMLKRKRKELATEKPKEEQKEKPKEEQKESISAQRIRSQAMNSMTKEEYEKFGIK